jgi:nicotinamidase/pyrazinamidase
MTAAFFDIDTQFDFLLPAGALYVPQAEGIIPTVAKLNHYAAAAGIPLISTVDAHAENDPEFRDWPPHCVAGTLGARKPTETLVGQIIVEKQQIEVFQNPELSELSRRLIAESYVVYGVATEFCVRSAALDLLKTGKPVTLVTDAIQAISPEGGETMFREFTALGGRLVTASEVMDGRFTTKESSNPR